MVGGGGRGAVGGEGDSMASGKRSAAPAPHLANQRRPEDRPSWFDEVFGDKAEGKKSPFLDGTDISDADRARRATSEKDDMRPAKRPKRRERVRHRAPKGLSAAQVASALDLLANVTCDSARPCIVSNLLFYLQVTE